jgi:hypothetical protein
MMAAMQLVETHAVADAAIMKKQSQAFRCFAAEICRVPI